MSQTRTFVIETTSQLRKYAGNADSSIEQEKIELYTNVRKDSARLTQDDVTRKRQI